MRMSNLNEIIDSDPTTSTIANTNTTINNKTETTINNNNNASIESTSQTNQNYFLLNSKIKKNDLETTNDSNQSQNNINNSSNTVFRNPNSIESFTAPSPAGSLIEQFDATATPLSVEGDSSDTNIDSSLSNSNQNLKSSTSFDPNNSNFRFRRHSSQSSINFPLNLQINNNTNNPTTSLTSSLTPTGSYPNINSNERVCSSPISSLKMSSRVCQIKIDEGIEPHLSREIKSERETQNTLKLKSSCDELMINSDDLGLDSFSFDRNNPDRNTNSPSFLNTSSTNGSSTFKRYRTFSESLNNTVNTINNPIGIGNGNMPSPSISSCQSYSNSSSPTGFLLANNNHNSNNTNNLLNSGLLRCFSPSTTLTNQNLNQTQLNQNYFSQSPSPTRKLFVTRRSMSPIPCNLRPSSLNTSNFNNNKRKISDVEQSDLNTSIASSSHSPKRSFIDTQQDFVQPLLIFTGNNNNNSNNNQSSNNVPTIPRFVGRYSSSSPSPSILNTTPSSPNQSSLVITAHNKQNEQTVNESMIKPTTLKTKLKTDEDNTNKYTFVPIQLPPPSNSPGLINNNNNSQQQLQHKRLSVLTSNSIQSQSISQTNSINNCMSNSPNSYTCDSPISCSPSVSNISSSINGDKPDSGYQSSAQNNSDSESCT